MHRIKKLNRTLLYYLGLTMLCIVSAMILLLTLSHSKNPQSHASESAKNALLATVDLPESVNIRAVSSPDSVYGREFISESEFNSIGSLMMKVSDSISRKTSSMSDFGFSDPEVRELINRQMTAMSVLRSHMRMPDDKTPVDKSFSGWKVKIDYDAKNKEGASYRSEYWAILDKTGQHVIKSFELPII